MTDISGNVGPGSSRSMSAQFTTRRGTQFSMGRGTPVGNIGVDTSDLDKLRTKLQGVTTDITLLAKAIETKLTPALTAAGNAFAGITGGKGGKGGGSTNTVAPVSAGGGGGAYSGALALGALGEIGSQAAGGINTYLQSARGPMYSLSSGAGQLAGIGGGNSRGIVTAFSGVSNLSPTDLAQAQSTLMSNQFMVSAMLNPKSSSSKNLNAFMNALQKMNPTLGSAGAASFANALTTGPVLQLANRYVGSQGILANTNGTVNNPNQIFQGLLKLVTGGQNVSQSQMRSMATAGGFKWQQAANNLAGVGISSQDITYLRQWLAAGGSTTGAAAAQAGNPALTALGATSAATQTQVTAYTQTYGAQNTLNRFDTAVQHVTASLLKLSSGVDSLLGLGAGGTSRALSAASKGAVGLAGLDILTKGKVSAAGKSIWSKIFGGIGKGVTDIVENPVVDTISEDVTIAGDPTGSTTTSGLSPSLARRVSAMKASNPNLRITSGHRTAAQQANLYAAKGGRGVARPGHSMHQLGKAVDIGPPSQLGWIARNASKFGLYRPAPKSEPWHLQTMGDPNDQQGFTSTQWAIGFLNQLPGAAKAMGASDPRVKFLESWIQGEGTFSLGNQFNPLDIEGGYGKPSGYYNSAGVRTYGSLQSGYSALDQFLQQSYDAPVLTALKSGHSKLPNLFGALGSSNWAGGGAGAATNKNYASYIASIAGSSMSAGAAAQGGSASIVGGTGASSGGFDFTSSTTSASLLRMLTGSGTTAQSNFLAQVSGAAPGGLTMNSKLMAAERALSSNKSAQTALLLGAALESGQASGAISQGALASIGDPSFYPAPVSAGAGSSSLIAGARITLSMPIQLVGAATKTDADNLVSMVLDALNREANKEKVSN